MNSAFLFIENFHSHKNEKGEEMKRSIVILSIVLVGFLFGVSLCSAACPFQDGHYATVKKLVPGKTKVLEKWECVKYLTSEHANNGICFENRINEFGDFQYICITGEYRLEFPINIPIRAFYY